MSDSIRIGTWRFEVAYMETRERKGRPAEKQPRYQCPRCKLTLWGDSLHGHMLAHDRRDEKSRSTEAARHLGMGAKPLPGQLGIGLFGVADVPVEAE